MIPSDVASRLQLTADAAVTRPASVQQVADALADLVPGQRVIAEIQALLPNGVYRALVNQRDVTLALPFSAKSGDSLELEVVDNDGKLALAVVSRRTTEATGGERPAVETTLSRTGNFIAGLLARPQGGNEAAARPAQLNANQPIATAPPAEGADLVPLLKQAISQSGMFYESHQSQWVSNRLPTEALLAEPQGRLSLQQAETGPGRPAGSANVAANPAANPTASVVGERPPGSAENAAAAGNSEANATMRSPTAAVPVAQDLLPLVQQQLEALASQTYVWQGQAWPGQAMQWEIVEENGGQKQQTGGTEQTPWQTRLTLTMPQLGEVRASLRISGGELALSLSTQSSDAAIQLANGGDTLRNQLEAAGLKLNGFSVGRHDRPAE